LVVLLVAIAFSKRATGGLGGEEEPAPAVKEAAATS
jgi:hypothetical protein